MFGSSASSGQRLTIYRFSAEFPEADTAWRQLLLHLMSLSTNFMLNAPRVPSILIPLVIFFALAGKISNICSNFISVQY